MPEGAYQVLAKAHASPSGRLGINLIFEKASAALLPGSSIGNLGEGDLRLSFPITIENLQFSM